MTTTARGAWTIWGIAAAFYAYGFFQRVAPSVIVDELMLAFALDATLLGTLSAAYFYTYAAMQIPIGILIDRYGARLTLAAGALTAAIGGILFALADGLTAALLGRALIGAGVGAGYIGTLKLVGAWFPLQRFGLLAGLTLAAGTGGAIGAQVPLSFAVALFDWRPTLLAAGIAGLAIALLIATVVRNEPASTAAHIRPGSTGSPHPSPQLGLGGILRRRETWLLVLVAGFTGAPILTFAGLWGVPYFVQVQGVERATAASLTSLMLIAWAVGGPLLGGVADRVTSRTRLMMLVAAANTLLWLPFILHPTLPLWLALPLVVALGLGGGCMIVAFAIVRNVFGTAAAGRALGIVNSSVLLVGAAMQTLFGSLLDQRWAGATHAGSRVYGAEAYAAGFLLFAVAGGIVTAAALTLLRAERQHS